MEPINGEEEKAPFIDAEATDSEYGEQGYPREQFIIRPNPLRDEPKDYLVHAILVTIFCFLPVGIVAIIKAVETQRASRAGDKRLAKESSNAALRMVRISLVIGIVIKIALVIWVIYVGLTLPHDEPYYHYQWN